MDQAVANPTCATPQRPCATSQAVANKGSAMDQAVTNPACAMGNPVANTCQPIPQEVKRM